MTLLDTGATRALRAALAQQLTDQGDIQSDAWRRVVEDVPRHPFVPLFYRQVGADWEEVTPRHPEYLDAVYSNRALTTQVTDGTPTSSSSEPGLMLQMLEALDVTEDHRVCEIATGTGYNAALLSARVGSKNVVTVEVDTNLAQAAQERLAQCGYKPTVHAGDGRQGHTAGAPYDRLIATCGFSTLPYAWVQQMRPDGILVCPLGWGNARLTVQRDGTASGRFLPGGSCFMSVREEGSSGGVPYPGTPSAPQERATQIDPALLTDEGVQFLLSVALPDVIGASEQDGNGSLTGHRLWSRDGSWAHASEGRVKQSGPTRLWDVVENAHAWYVSHGMPQRGRFGVTVTPTGQTIWLDSPDNPAPAIRGAESRKA
ncbi:methyltransferase domain-containing protein [Streptomyces luteireticuli]|uniref:methyltransferase domain-containing protein n=1 Tax=Streptomyces luteireticuli TaxID=173858 RepID=UPI0035590D61